MREMAQAAAAETVREMAEAAAMLVAGIKILHNGIIRVENLNTCH